MRWAPPRPRGVPRACSLTQRLSSLNAAMEQTEHVSAQHTSWWRVSNCHNTIPLPYAGLIVKTQHKLYLGCLMLGVLCLGQLLLEMDELSRKTGQCPPGQAADATGLNCFQASADHSSMLSNENNAYLSCCSLFFCWVTGEYRSHINWVVSLVNPKNGEPV